MFESNLGLLLPVAIDTNKFHNNYAHTYMCMYSNNKSYPCIQIYAIITNTVSI